MSRGYLLGNEPLFTSLSLLAIDVSEGLVSLQQQGNLLVDDLTVYQLDNLFIDLRDVETLVSNQPFLTSLSGLALVVFACSDGSDL
jgi:hypothetical protein